MLCRVVVRTDRNKRYDIELWVSKRDQKEEFFRARQHAGDFVTNEAGARWVKKMSGVIREDFGVNFIKKVSLSSI